MKVVGLETMAVCALFVIGGGMLCCLAAFDRTPDVEIAGFATSLEGRTPGQRHNASLASRALNGVSIAPGAVFSFNQTVQSWSQDRGYVKAPVSYDGELVKAFGGGVCQTSTTLYNVALLAGLPIVERHSHVFAPHYVPPGRDAAVAQRNIDLRFRNPFAYPLRLRACAEGNRLDIRLYGRRAARTDVRLGTELLAFSEPARLTRVVHRPGGMATRAYVRNPGATGMRVLSYRAFYQQGHEMRRERLSDDTYASMNRLVQLNEAEKASTDTN